MLTHEQTQEETSTVLLEMQGTLEKQKRSYLSEGMVTAETRIDRIDRSIDLMIRYQDDIVEALRHDFGHRSPHQSMLFDAAGLIGPMQHIKKQLRNWMKPEKRKLIFPLSLLGARGRVEYQPLGVVGIISPWNFPFSLSFGPLANVFAAGNRAMIKPTELTPACSELMAKMIREAYDETEVAVFTGGPDVGQAFSSLAFDHLLFTGSGSIARHVMRAAAENLVPVTLELGGKSPVIVGRSADLKQAADRIMLGKMLNAGQICISPDYLFVPEEKRDELVEHMQAALVELYPTLLDNPDYTSVINKRHRERLEYYLEDAKEKGASLVKMNPAGENFSLQPAYKMLPTLILNPTENMKCMQDEVFGPIMAIKTYKSIDDVINYINAHERPLGLYYFGRDSGEEHQVVGRTTSGGVTINDVMMHAIQEELPFGGVGGSGMGSYHGHAGFKNFSHAKSVYKQPKIDVAGLGGLRPPFGKTTEDIIKKLMKR